MKALTSFKGVKENTALTIISELGDIRRFDHPKRITSYAGFDIVEYSSGGHQKQYNVSSFLKLKPFLASGLNTTCPLCGLADANTLPQRTKWLLGAGVIATSFSMNY